MWWRRRIVRAVLFVAVAQAVGLVGAYLTADSIGTWYATLDKPSFAPPNWLFGPAWTLLYTLMGIAASILYGERDNKTDAKRALTLYWVQLGVNAVWTPVFFGLERPDVAFYIILALDVLVAALVWLSFTIHRTAAYLLLPYLAWILFATLLNYSLWQLNA